MLSDRRYFTEFINADDGLAQLKPGEYINAENIRIGSSDKGKFDRFERVGGTDQLFADLPAGTNYCIGSFADEPNNRIIFFIWNNQTSPVALHRIYLYDVATGDCKIVLRQENFASGQTGLAFSKSKMITGVGMAGDVLYFIDCDGTPKRVNVVRYAEANAEISPNVYPTDYTDDMFTVIRKQPKYPPQVLQKYYDNTVTSNFIADQSFQFCTRFRFKDNEVSALGEWSPLVSANIPGENYNYIGIIAQFNTSGQMEPITEDIKEVDIIVRYGNTGKSFIISTQSVTTATTGITYSFFNDKIGIPVDDNSANKLYDLVPLTSEALEIAKNRLFLANNTQGYDTPSSTSLAGTLTSITNPANGTRVLKSNSTRKIGIQFKDFAGRYIGGVVTNDSLEFRVGSNTYDPTGYAGTSIPFMKEIAWTLSNASALTEIPEGAVTYEIMATKDTTHDSFVQGISAGVFYIEQNADTNVLENPSKTFNSKQKYIKVDISWLPRVKMGYTFTQGDLVRLYWNKVSGSSYVQTYKDFAIKSQDGTAIYLDIEQLDTGRDLGDTSSTTFYFEIWTPYTGSEQDTYYGTGNVYKINDAGTSAREYSVTSGVVRGDVFILKRKSNKILTPVYAYGRGNRTYASGAVPDFKYQSITGNESGRESGIPFNKEDIDTGNYLTEPYRSFPASFDNYQSPIAVFKNPSNAKIDTSAQLKIPYRIWGFQNGATYSVTFECRKYNVGNTYSVVAGKTITENDSTDDTVTIEMPKITIEAGKWMEYWFVVSYFNTNFFNVSFFEKADGTLKHTSPNDTNYYDGLSIEWYSETMNPSEINWSVWDRDLGKPSQVTKLGQAIRETQISFSNTYIQDSQVNGLSSFEVLNQDSLDIKCGAIRKLVYTSKVNQMGNVMVSICERETASIYLGETQLVASNTNAFLAQSTATIGTINILRGSYGTTNPESVVEYKGMIYWFDANNGSYVHYSEAGLFPFSQYKFQRPANLFALQYRSLSQSQIEALGSRPFVIGCVNPYHKEVFFTIPRVLSEAPNGNLPTYSPVISYPYDMYDGQGKTLVYSILNDKWSRAETFTAEAMCYMANELYSFKSGALYRHNSTTSDTFYGVPFSSKLMFVSNINPMQVKSFESLEIEGQNAPDFTNLYTDYPNVQTSDLEAGDWDDREGVFYSNILRDRISPNTSGDYDIKMNFGDKMRGQYMMCMMEFNGDVNLSFVNINYIPSIGHSQK